MFYDFRHNNGHVTKTQFRQCLTYLQLNASEEEMKALEAKFCNDMGFNYIAFLQELQPYTPPDFMYEKRLEDVRQTNVRTRLPETDPISDLEGVLIKIKTKVGYQWLLSWQADKRPLFTNTRSTCDFKFTWIEKKFKKWFSICKM